MACELGHDREGYKGSGRESQVGDLQVYCAGDVPCKKAVVVSKYAFELLDEDGGGEKKNRHCLLYFLRILVVMH